MKADISKCDGKGCPIKEKCYRYTAKDDEVCQAYLTLSDEEKKDCKYFYLNK